MARPDNNFDTGAEDAVLATLLLYPEARDLAFSMVGPQNFSHANRMNLFVGLRCHHRSGLEITPDAACNMILSQDDRTPRQQLPFIPGVSAYVAKLLTAVSSPKNIEFYCEIILSRPQVVWWSPEELRQSDNRDILAARVKRLKAELAQALEALGHASIDKRPLTEREKAFGQWLIDKIGLYSQDSEEGPCPDL